MSIVLFDVYPGHPSLPEAGSSFDHALKGFQSSLDGLERKSGTFLHELLAGDWVLSSSTYNDIHLYYIQLKKKKDVGFPSVGAECSRDVFLWVGAVRPERQPGRRRPAARYFRGCFRSSVLRCATRTWAGGPLLTSLRTASASPRLASF